jgi:L-lactate utilization protein LutB
LHFNTTFCNVEITIACVASLVPHFAKLQILQKVLNAMMQGQIGREFVEIILQRAKTHFELATW